MLDRVVDKKYELYWLSKVEKIASCKYNLSICPSSHWEVTKSAIVQNSQNRSITSSLQFSSSWFSVPTVLQRHKLWIGLITVLIPHCILVIPSVPIPPRVGFGNAPQRPLSSGQIRLQNQHNVILLEIFNNFCSLSSSVEQRKILLKPIKSKCEILLHTSIKRDSPAGSCSDPTYICALSVHRQFSHSASHS